MTSVIPYDPLFQVWTELQGLFIRHLLLLTFEMFYDKYIKYTGIEYIILLSGTKGNRKSS